jgi:proteasome lid subunit RPN8/RPN11
MPRFVLLFHDCPTSHPRPSHFDLMLEANGALRTWAIADLPRCWRATAGLPKSVGASSSDNVAAEQLPDHRLAYLDYEGPVSGERGKVTRVDHGTFTNIEESPDSWVAELSGHTIHGQLTLQRELPDSLNWQLAFEPSAAIDRS